jgi:hypothetical protein
MNEKIELAFHYALEDFIICYKDSVLDEDEDGRKLIKSMIDLKYIKRF